MTNEEKATKIAESLNKANGSNCLLPCHQAAIAMAEWKDSQPQIIEIFGKRVKVKRGNGTYEQCNMCAFLYVCNIDNPICETCKGKFNRYFVEVDKDGNDKGGQND